MINVIVAVDSEYGIGLNNQMPWKIRDELQIFKNKTINSVIIAGRKTIDYLPVLKDRKILCISRSITENSKHISQGFIANKDNIDFATSIEHAIEKAKKYNMPIFVIGGSQIYNEVFKTYKKDIIIHISFLKNSHKCDTFFNKNNLEDFYIKEKISYELFDHYVMTYQTYGEHQYINVVKDILLNNEIRLGRNGSTMSEFGKHLKFDLRDGFPLLTTKKMFLKGIVEELLFFLRGDTNSKILEEKNIKIWNGNTNRHFLDNNGFKDRLEGFMGPMYGAIWRHFNGNYDETNGRSTEGIDQLQNVIHEIKTNPTSRRILLTTFNPSQVNLGVLWPCHSITIQFYVQDGFLDMFCYNRSSDIFLGLPFNIASSSLLLMLISKICELTPRFFNLSLGDAHIYSSHIESIKHQIERIPFKFPQIILPEIKQLDDINSLTFKDFEIIDYNCYSAIKADMIA